jgi:hypothetical protein
MQGRRWVLLTFSLLVRMGANAQSTMLIQVPIKKDMQVVLPDTSYVTRKDTIFRLTREQIDEMKVRPSPYIKSGVFFDSLKRRSGRHKITRELFSLFVKTRKKKEKLIDAITISEQVFKPFAGLRIASIIFRTVDLLEGSVTDTLQVSNTRFGKFVNRVHKDTRARIVNRNLLFNVGDFLDPYVLADNERLLRQFIAIRDARIYVTRSIDSEEEVDIVVVTQDITSLGVGGTVGSVERFRFDLYDKNILGYARQLRVSYFRNAAADTRNGYEITFKEPNFFGSFLQGEIQYTDNYFRRGTRASLGRDFFTPEIKYAGGAEIYHTRENFYFEDYDTLKISYTENAIDIWAGRSFEFKKRNNLIFAARVNPRDFLRRPFVAADSNSFFYRRTLFLGSVSLTRRNYLKSLRIRGFGKTEDIPVGATISLTGGKEVNEFTDRYFIEWKAIGGRYLRGVGYFNLSLAAGTYMKGRSAEDGLIQFNSTYFSDLIRVQAVQVRQFFYVTYTRGFHRVLDQTLRIAGKWRNEERFFPLGDQRLTMGFETVYFTRWYFYGFQFALFHRVDINLLAMNSALFSRASAFPSVRVGMRTLNDNLVLPLLSMEFAYFGKNRSFPSAWEVRITTSMPNLFLTGPSFRPAATLFN